MIKKHTHILENISYLDIFSFQISYIFLISFLISLTPENLISYSDAKYNTNSFLDYFYFTIVTYTSLGYGEIVPVKFGRYISILTIIVGFISLSLLISKISSEKSNYTTRFLLTSDQQRRLREFKKNIINYIETFSTQGEEKKKTNHPVIEMRRTIKNKNVEINIIFGNKSKPNGFPSDLFSLNKYLSSIYNYIKFNSQNTDLIFFGSRDELVDLLKNIGALCKKIESLEYPEKEKINIIEQYSKTIAFLIKKERSSFRSPSKKILQYFIGQFSIIKKELKSKKFQKFKKQLRIVIKSKDFGITLKFLRTNNFYSFRDFYYTEENELEKILSQTYKSSFDERKLFQYLYKDSIEKFLEKHYLGKITDIPNEVDILIKKYIHRNDQENFRSFFYTELDSIDECFSKYKIRK